VEEEYIGRFGVKRLGIYISRKIIGSIKKEVWGKRQ